MIRCCYKCTERWVKDGKTCHSTCKRYADAVAENERKRELKIKANESELAFRGYKKDHYKAVDRRHTRAEKMGRRKY